MTTVTTPRLPRGMRDILPDGARRRAYVIDILKTTFERFGFEPIETPALELLETLTDKYGPEADRLIFRAGLGAEADLGLRYDLTVPLARACAMHSDLPLPFRRYQIAPLWRGERPQRGRYREFMQADIDIVGTSSLQADAEIILLIVDVLGQLGFKDNLTKINNRKVLTGIGRYAGVADPLLPGLFRAIDKLDKIGPEGVRLELRGVGLPGDLLNRQRQAIDRWLGSKADLARLGADLEGALDASTPPGILERAVPAFLEALGAEQQDLKLSAEVGRRVMEVSLDALRREVPETSLIADDVTDRILAVIGVGRGDGAGAGASSGEVEDSLAAGGGAASVELLDGLENFLEDDSSREGISELRAVLDALAASELSSDRYVVDLALVRGLDYYTGTIFETVVTDPPIGSITGGGRYDRLLAMFGRDLPAVGTSLGVDRLVDAMEAQDLFPPEIDTPTVEVLVARFASETANAGFALAADLRRKGLAVELYLDDDGIGDQIRYALKRQMRVVLILGPDELRAGTVSVRDLQAATQSAVPIDDVAMELRRLLNLSEHG